MGFDMNYTDEQLKSALVKMLPECVFESGDLYIYDNDFGSGGHRQVLDTELLHLCWLVEGTLSRSQECDYFVSLNQFMRASWQQKVIALAKVKGIEI